MSQKTWMLLVVVCAMGLLVLGCKGKELRPPVPSEMPGWCVRDSGVAADPQRGRLVIGVGRVDGIKSPEMARVNVDGQARKQVAQIFNVYVEILLARYRDYVDEAGEGTPESELADTQRALAKMNLRAGDIADRYADSENNIWYAAAVLPYDAFSARIAANTELSGRFKAFVRQVAPDIFPELPRHLSDGGGS